MRKMFELSKETSAVLAVIMNMRSGEEMSFEKLSEIVGFPVVSTSGCYQSAKRLAERDHATFIGGNRGVGFFRGSGTDIADSLEPMAKRIHNIAKQSISRADLAIASNLPQDTHQRVVERRTRASLIYSTTSAELPTSNRKRPEPAQEAPKVSPSDALRRAI